MRKNAQLNVFILIGVVLVIVAGSVYYLSSRKSTEVRPGSAVPQTSLSFDTIGDSLQQCLEKVALEAIKIYGLHNAETSIKNYVNMHYDECVGVLKTQFTSQGYQLENPGSFGVTGLEITDKAFILDLTYPLSARKGDSRHDFDTFRFTMPLESYVEVTNGIIPAGSIIQSSDLSATLSFDQDTTVSNPNGPVHAITLKLLDNNFDFTENAVVLSPVIYEGLPSRTTFDPPATLTVKLDPAMIPADVDKTKLKVAWKGEDGIWQAYKTRFEPEDKLIAEVPHLTPTGTADCGQERQIVIDVGTIYRSPCKYDPTTKWVTSENNIYIEDYHDDSEYDPAVGGTKSHDAKVGRKDAYCYYNDWDKDDQTDTYKTQLPSCSEYFCYDVDPETNKVLILPDCQDASGVKIRYLSDDSLSGKQAAQKYCSVSIRDILNEQIVVDWNRVLDEGFTTILNSLPEESTITLPIDTVDAFTGYSTTNIVQTYYDYLYSPLDILSKNLHISPPPDIRIIDDTVSVDFQTHPIKYTLSSRVVNIIKKAAIKRLAKNSIKEWGDFEFTGTVDEFLSEFIASFVQTTKEVCNLEDNVFDAPDKVKDFVDENVVDGEQKNLLRRAVDMATDALGGFVRSKLAPRFGIPVTDEDGNIVKDEEGKVQYKTDHGKIVLHPLPLKETTVCKNINNYILTTELDTLWKEYGLKEFSRQYLYMPVDVGPYLPHTKLMDIGADFKFSEAVDEWAKTHEEDAIWNPLQMNGNPIDVALTTYQYYYNKRISGDAFNDAFIPDDASCFLKTRLRKAYVYVQIEKDAIGNFVYVSGTEIYNINYINEVFGKDDKNYLLANNGNKKLLFFCGADDDGWFNDCTDELLLDVEDLSYTIGTGHYAAAAICGLKYGDNYYPVPTDLDKLIHDKILATPMTRGYTDYNGGIGEFTIPFKKDSSCIDAGGKGFIKAFDFTGLESACSDGDTCRVLQDDPHYKKYPKTYVDGNIVYKTFGMHLTNDKLDAQLEHNGGTVKVTAKGLLPVVYRCNDDKETEVIAANGCTDIPERTCCESASNSPYCAWEENQCVMRGSCLVSSEDGTTIILEPGEITKKLQSLCYSGSLEVCTPKLAEKDVVMLGRTCCAHSKDDEGKTINEYIWTTDSAQCTDQSATCPVNYEETTDTEACNAMNANSYIGCARDDKGNPMVSQYCLKRGESYVLCQKNCPSSSDKDGKTEVCITTEEAINFGECAVPSEGCSIPLAGTDGMDPSLTLGEGEYRYVPGSKTDEPDKCYYCSQGSYKDVLQEQITASHGKCIDQACGTGVFIGQETCYDDTANKQYILQRCNQIENRLAIQKVDTCYDYSMDTEKKQITDVCTEDSDRASCIQNLDCNEYNEVSIEPPLTNGKYGVVGPDCIKCVNGNGRAVDDIYCGICGWISSEKLPVGVGMSKCRKHVNGQVYYDPCVKDEASQSVHFETGEQCSSAEGQEIKDVCNDFPQGHGANDGCIPQTPTGGEYKLQRVINYLCAYGCEGACYEVWRDGYNEHYVGQFACLRDRFGLGDATLNEINANYQDALDTCTDGKQVFANIDPKVIDQRVTGDDCFNDEIINRPGPNTLLQDAINYMCGYPCKGACVADADGGFTRDGFTIPGITPYANLRDQFSLGGYSIKYIRDYRQDALDSVGLSDNFCDADACHKPPEACNCNEMSNKENCLSRNS